MGKEKKVGVFFGIPFPVWVIGFLITGFGLGYLYPKSLILKAIYESGSYFPKTVVTFSALLIFILLSAAMAKLVLFHREKAGKLFGLIFVIYFAMGLVSLIYVSVLIPLLTNLPINQAGHSLPSPLAWLKLVGNTFSKVMTQQPLLQALVGSMIIGYLSGYLKVLRPLAHGFIKAGDLVLLGFKKLLWYYPIMIGCLAIGIPLKFGVKGVAMYGATVLWVAFGSLTWSVFMIILAKVATKRTFKQIFSYFGSVWPTGFGTGGSYDTLAVNLISAETDLGLKPEIAEVSIVFGTVLNKNVTTMAVLFVTITVCAMLKIPLSLTEILVLIPPVLILGLESPGIPGGAGFFMSPIIGVLLVAPDMQIFVTTFVTVYSGLIPMFATAGNTTSDGMVGALLQDRFSHYLGMDSKISKKGDGIGA